MPHKTFQGDIDSPDAFSNAMDNIIERALHEMKTRRLIGVTVTPLSAVGGYPFRFAVTVIGEDKANASAPPIDQVEALEIIVGEHTTRVE